MESSTCVGCGTPAAFIRQSNGTPQCGGCAELAHREQVRRRLTSLTLPRKKRRELAAQWRELRIRGDFHHLPLYFDGWRPLLPSSPAAGAAQLLQDAADLIERFGWDPGNQCVAGTVNAYDTRDIRFEPMAFGLAISAAAPLRRYEKDAAMIARQALATHAGIPSSEWEQGFLNIQHLMLEVTDIIHEAGHLS